MLGTWLPYALAEILAAIIAAAGRTPPRLADMLRAWGLRCMAGGARDTETDAALREFAALAARQEQQRNG